MDKDLILKSVTAGFFIIALGTFFAASISAVTEKNLPIAIAFLGLAGGSSLLFFICFAEMAEQHIMKAIAEKKP